MSESSARTPGQRIIDAINRFEGFQEPSPAQMENIKQLIGEKAFSYMQSLGAEIFVLASDICLPYRADGNERIDFEFIYRYMRRLVIIRGYKHKPNQFTKQENSAPMVKKLSISLCYELDYLREKLLEKMLPPAEMDNYIREKFLRRNPIGEDKTSIPFLRNMFNFIISIDPSVIILLSPSDSQRTRIFTRALRNYPNICFR